MRNCTIGQRAHLYLYSYYDHICDRGNSGETLFREQRNYPYFLKSYARYVRIKDCQNSNGTLARDCQS